MNKGLWIARKNYLLCLIQRVSQGSGGDDEAFLKQHCKEVIESHPDERIEDAIACYLELTKQVKSYTFGERN